MWGLVAVGVVVSTAVLMQCSVSKACSRSDYHIVQRGDSLWKIARMHGVALSMLCAANGFSERTIIHPGDKIFIPAKKGRDTTTTTKRTLNLQPGKRVYVRANNVNVRSRPSTSSKRLGMVSRGDTGTVIETCRQWIKVSFHKGTGRITGWVRMDLISACDLPCKQLTQGVSRDSLKHESNSGDGGTLAEMAQRYIGIPYRRASSYPSRGFDCSGFVYYLLHRLGVTVPRTASAMFNVGKPVKRSELRPGDLVFFKTTSRNRVTHVGIYIGNGKFVHASSGAGHVTISPLTHGYYANRYAGARRVIE
ncbi:MAG: NlpC/P60 family protein [Armatimonadota bacterium]|nr:NlpC/P60 family protein [Armatimonadota bacterium]MDW8025424.1 NlpC/P60 family protein [Armatimonadota bacterium]